MTLTAIRALAGADLRNVRRDSMLRWMAVSPIILALFARWLVPLADARLDVSLDRYHVLIVSVCAVFAGPVLIGFLAGALLLDERDDGTLQAIRVTPFSMRNYLAWKLTLPILVTTLLSVLSVPIAGLIHFQLSFTVAALLGALWGPILALAMAAFAKDKLQGFVLMRVTNLLLLMPMAVWFLDARWEPLFAVLPGYWSLKTFWLAAGGEPYLLCALIGMAYHAAVLAWLYRRFLRVLSLQ